AVDAERRHQPDGPGVADRSRTPRREAGGHRRPGPEPRALSPRRIAAGTGVGRARAADGSPETGRAGRRPGPAGRRPGPGPPVPYTGTALWRLRADPAAARQRG